MQKFAQLVVVPVLPARDLLGRLRKKYVPHTFIPGLGHWEYQHDELLGRVFEIRKHKFSEPISQDAFRRFYQEEGLVGPPSVFGAWLLSTVDTSLERNTSFVTLCNEGSEYYPMGDLYSVFEPHHPSCRINLSTARMAFRAGTTIVGFREVEFRMSSNLEPSALN